MTESEKGTFFDSGSAKMSEERRRIAHALATELGKASEHACDGRAYGFEAVHRWQKLWELGAVIRSRNARGG